MMERRKTKVKTILQYSNEQRIHTLYTKLIFEYSI